MHSISASSYDDKDALKSKSFGIFRVVAHYLCSVCYVLNTHATSHPSS
jgi:hypothetical protein